MRSGAAAFLGALAVRETVKGSRAKQREDLGVALLGHRHLGLHT